MFQFKWSSLMQFDEHCTNDVTLRGNLRRLFSVDDVASDCQMRDILDPIKPSELRKAFRAVYSGAQRGKVLEYSAIFGNRTLVSIDGTGLYSSTKVQCPQCCFKKHRNGQIEYYHQMLAAVIVHPDQKTVLPLDFEPITESDGDTKNDCERNAAKRLLLSIDQLYPRQFVVLEDALATNGPYVQTPIGYGMDFIINIEPVETHRCSRRCTSASCSATSPKRKRSWTMAPGVVIVSLLMLNASHPDIRVNMIEYWEEVENGNGTRDMSWNTRR